MKLTGIAADEFSSLRSIVLICLALVAANVSYRLVVPVSAGVTLEPRHGTKRPGGLAIDSLRLVDISALGEVPIGAHLISPRRFYIHHGIYLGAGSVAHYSGFSGALEAGPIEVTDLEHFASGRPVWIIEQPARYPANEVARRARSRLGENRYSLLANNCEHFCTWCLTGKGYSAQVGAYWHRPREFLATITALKALFVA
ncbi:lecithin retinol acyltransferase family protein [Pseudomonas sp. D2-30]|uniref:lecithin retinol acyltransferase family protein n=1 Tax=unclassified Pseudomonas TaxID=196821 RepID=UPI003DA90A46